MTLSAAWRAWLSQDPALADTGEVTAFTDLERETALLATTATKSPRPDLAVLELSGADALTFVHAQFSGDCRALTVGGTLLTAWCTPQGRVLYLPRLLRSDTAVYLLLPLAQAEACCKRLQLFVLRADVTITDLSANHGVIVVNRPAPADRLEVGTDLVSATSADQRQCWLLGPFAALGSAWRALTAPAVGTSAATLAEIRLGLPPQDAALAAQFLPQELNLDLVGGVSFNKGCYPGQEIVARVKFRGSVKRRLQRYRARGTALPAASTRVLDGNGAAVGTVVASAPANADTFELLAVVELEAGALVLAPATPLTAAELPYAIAS